MKKNKIKTSLYLFIVAIFLFIATFVTIIITQGGSVEDGKVKSNTGVLRININPENIPYRLYIDNEPINNIVNRGVNVISGYRDIKIEADGMNIWTKRVNITQGIVNDIFVKLFPLNLKIEQITSSGNIDRIFFSQSGEYLYYIIKDEIDNVNNGIWRMQLTNNSIFTFSNPLTPTKFSGLNDELYEIITGDGYQIYPSLDNNKIIINSKSLQKIYLVNSIVGNEKEKFIDIKGKIGFYPNYVNWLNDSISLIVSNENIFYEYDLTNNKSILINYNPKDSNLFDSNQFHLIWFNYYSNKLINYKNQLNTVIDFVPNEILLNIKSIHLPQKSESIVIIDNGLNYYLIDLEDKKYYLFDIISTEYSLIDISDDSTTYIFKDINNKYISVTARKNLALEKYDININELNISNNSIVKFAFNSSTILVFNEDDKTIYSMDEDGQNILPIIQDNNIDSKEFNFDIRSEGLFVVITQGITKDIYKINLLSIK